MGVLFICDTFDYSCAYGSWNNVRMELFRATMRFLESKKNEIHINNINNNNGYDYKSICDILSKQEEITDVDKFLIVYDEDRKLLNNLIYFDVYGIYALLNKADDTGFYSPGNAFDILCLISIVSPYIEVEDIKERMLCIKKLFKKSVKTGKYIHIM